MGAPLERLLEEVSGGDEIKTREFSVLSSLLKEIENKKSELQNIRNVIETENAILRDLKTNKQETVSITSPSILSSPVFLISALANIASGGYFLYSSVAN